MRSTATGLAIVALCIIGAFATVASIGRVIWKSISESIEEAESGHEYIREGRTLKHSGGRPPPERVLVAQDEVSATYAVYWWEPYSAQSGQWIKRGPTMQTVPLPEASK